MEKQTILNAHKDRDEGIIIHEVPEPGKDNKKIKYAAVIGGINWPTDLSPIAYFCIVGKIWDEEYRPPGREEKKGNLVLLDEGKSDSLSLEAFINQLTDSAKTNYCDRFYANLSEEFCGYIESFQGYVNRNKIKNPRPGLQEAPYVNNFLNGLQLIKEYEREKKIEIPEDTLVYKQLKTIGREHLKDKPETDFFAINALRYVIGAFFKFDLRPVILPRRVSRPWMAA